MPGLIPDHIIEQVRQSNDVVDVIGSYFPLKRAGANFRTLCPFHKEKTPSFNVNPQKQIWHCFGCGAGGDVFSFVMKYESLEFMDAVRRLAERAGVRIEVTEGGGGGPSRDQKDTLLKLHEQVAALYHHTLMKESSAEIARAYLKKRQINAETAKRWQIGYSPDLWDGLIQWASAKKISVSLLETAGLVLRRDGGDGFYDRFRGRLMFPIRDEQGRVVAFSGRILTDAKDQPKYVNSPETPIFQKGKLLFALDKAKRAIIEEKVAIICEGQIDTISCHEAGVANVVAPQGTALTEQHARILKRHADEVVLMFDSDAAGQNAAVRSAEALLAAGLVFRVAVLPPGHDPDSFVKALGADALKKLIAGAPGFFAFHLEQLTHRFDAKTERGKMQIALEIVPFLATVPNSILLSTYLQQAAVRLEIPEAALLKELGKFRARGRHINTATAAEPDATAVADAADKERARGLPAEVLLLRLMLAEPEVIEVVVEGLRTEWLTNSIAGRLIERVLAMLKAGRWTGPNVLVNDLTDGGASQLVSELLMTPMPGAAGQAAGDCLTSLNRHWIEARLSELRRQLAGSGLSNAVLIKLQGEVLDLRRQLDHIARLSLPKNQK